MTAYINKSITSRFRSALASARKELGQISEVGRISYPLGSIKDAAAHFAAREEFGYTYGRTGTPAGSVLEGFLASLEGGTSAVALSSGQAANYLALRALLPKAGDEIVASSRVFGGTASLLTNELPNIGRRARFADPARSESFEAEINENTRAIFVETVSNPDGTVADLEALAGLAQKYHIPLIVDNTLATPLLARPIEWGANIVTSSLTKFFNGHGDVLAGAVIDAGNFDWDKNGQWPALSTARANGVAPLTQAFQGAAFAALVRQHLTLFGPSLNPLDVPRILDNAANLDERLESHIRNAKQVAKFLKGHPQVEWVHFVGDSDHPGSVRARKYLAGPPALLLFKPKGGTEGAARLVDALAHIGHEANIGYEKTLIIHSFDTTHRLFTPEQKGAARIEEGALRLSVGTEDVSVILSDLDQALTRAKPTVEASAPIHRTFG